MDGREKTMEIAVRARAMDYYEHEQGMVPALRMTIRMGLVTNRAKLTMTYLELVHPFKQLARRREIDVLLQLERDDVGDGHRRSGLGAVQTR